MIKHILNFANNWLFLYNYSNRLADINQDKVEAVITIKDDFSNITMKDI